MTETQEAVLDRAERLERLSGELYRLLGRLMPEASSAREVYLRLAAEEDEHAQRVCMLRGRLAQRASPPEFAFDLAQADRMLADAQELKALLDRDQPVLGPQEAHRFMVEHERRFGALHAQALVGADPELATLFSLLAWQDEMHRKVLEQLG